MTQRLNIFRLLFEVVAAIVAAAVITVLVLWAGGWDAGSWSWAAINAAIALVIVVPIIGWRVKAAVGGTKVLMAAMKGPVTTERLALIAQRTSNAVIITNVLGGIEWVNEGFTRMSGYTLDEVAGKTPRQVLQGPGSDPAARQRMSDAMGRGEAVSVEILNYGKTGREYVVSVEITPLRDAHNVLTGFMGLQTDITERVTEETAQKRRELLLREMEHAASVGGWSLDVASGKVEWTAQTHVIHELPPDFDPTLDTAVNFYAPQAQPIIAAAVARGMETGQPWDLELPLITAKGRAIWVRAVGRAEMRDGRAVRLFGAFQDITAQRQASEALRRVTERFEMATRAGGVGIWDLALVTDTLTWDDQMFRLYSVDQERFGGNYAAWRACVHPDDQARVDEAVRIAIAGERELNTEFRVVWPTGQIRHIRVMANVQRDDEGRALRMVGTNWDVTERVETQRRIADSERRLRTIIEAEPECVKVISPDGRLLEMNGAGLMLLEVDLVEQVRGLSLAQFVLPEYCDAFAELHSGVMRGEKRTLTFQIRGQRGTLRWLDSHAVPLRDERGAVTSVLAVTRDITSHKEAEEQLRTANAELDAARAAADAASRAKSEFLANMSHEIRTPLTAILGFTDVLRDDPVVMGSPERRATLDTIKQASTHLLTVINDILDLSKIEADMMTVEAIETPLLTVLREVEALMRPRAAGRGLVLTTTLSSPLPTRIKSDPTRLRQILMNLVGNAVKFTEAGSVSISAGAAEFDGRSRLVIDVQDTGLGMTPAQAGRAFQAFGQADETVTRKHGGSGLGLTICRRLSALMGGDVKLLSTEPGTGSRFRLVLPLEPVPGSPIASQFDGDERAPAPAVNGLASLNGRILLAEDGPDNQRLIALHLRKAGAIVDIADNGRIAMEKIDNAAGAGTPYDLLLTDMQMPEMDGYTLARTLRQRGSTLAIIALTAHAMAEDRDKCLNAGCDDYATKPIDKHRLRATCAAWMGKVGGLHEVTITAAA